MARQSVSKVTSLVARGLRTSPSPASRLSLLTTAGARPTTTTPLVSSSLWKRTAPASRQFFSTTQSQAKGILPDSDDPAPPNVETSPMKAAPAALSDQDYHELADEYLGIIQDRLEEVAEQNEQVDVLYEAGVLNVTFPDIGTYVINKQPPNKQIWLSSPISGPKRYDYVVYGEGQAQKEDTAVGDWVYLRDGSTINQLFVSELDIDLDLPLPQ